MSRRPRYEVLGIEDRGRRVVRILDRTSDETLQLHAQGESVMHWDEDDRRVEDRKLRKVAREALSGA